MSYVVNFLTFLLISYFGNWTSSKILKNIKIKTWELVILSLPVPTILTLSYLNSKIEDVLKLILGASFADYSINNNLPETAALLLYPILWSLIGVSSFILFGYFILKTLKTLGDNKTKKLFFFKFKSKLLLVSLGLIIILITIRVLALSNFIR